MNRAFLTALLAVAIVGGACTEDRQKRIKACDDVTIEISVKNDGIFYPTKSTDPVPGFQRGCPFKVKTNWLGANSQTLTLSNFVAVNYKAAAQKWQDPEPRKIDGTDDSVTFDTSKEVWGPYTLPSTKPVGPPRLILFTVTLKTGAGDLVSFDPPWSEKKRG